MSRQAWLADALQDAGLDVVCYVGWETRGSATFNPRGLVLHHTGPWKTVKGMVDLCINGYAGLPGPLCQVVLDPAGICHVIASGKANHAGEGGWKGLSGNASVLGIEAIHSGSTASPWPAAQLDAYRHATAAIIGHLGVGAGMVCGHREWSPTRKVDPVGINLDRFRSDVAALITPPVPMEVPPRMSPPIEIAGKVVDVLKAPAGGVWMLTDIGAVYAWECPDLGAPNRHPEYWPADARAARLEPLGEGFTVIRSDGSRYDYPA